MAEKKKPIALITGFPGFITARLVQTLLEESPCRYREIVLLVEGRMKAIAERRLSELVSGESPTVRLVVGDITEPDLGMAESDSKALRRAKIELWHLAAIYDLAVPSTLAYRINVDGTERVLDFAESCKHFGRLHYISTCYVAGLRSGRCFEDELDCGQAFKNHYESTKFWAEKCVQKRWESIPTTIYRPGIVVGDSVTGETIKGDGPYFIMNLLMKLPKWVPMVDIGASQATVNIVPVDFLVNAMVEIGRREETIGQVYQLADPEPALAKDIVRWIIDYLGRAPVVGTVPSFVAEKLIGVKQVEELVGIPKEAMVYFNHPITYDVSNTLAALQDTSVKCPRLKDYLPTLIDYAKRHPDIFELNAR